MEAVEIDRVLASLEGDESTEATELRSFFARVEDIRNFGEEQLGLMIGKSYRNYLSLDQDYLVMVVNAAPPHSLEPYLWHYPFFGPAPYRGYYNPEHAEEEAARLRKEGYEVWLRKVDAFSTLGITSDPLISFMQNYSELGLARLIIHEQIHATLWVDGAIQFNEELATALADHGALAYLTYRYGDTSEELWAARDAIHNSAMYLDDLRSLAALMDDYFLANSDTIDDGSMSLTLPREEYPPEFIEGREEIIRKFKESFLAGYNERYIGDGYRSFADLDLNTAYLSLFRTYSGRGEAYQDLYAKIGSVKETLQRIRSALDAPDNYGIEFKPGDDPFVIIEGLLKSE